MIAKAQIIKLSLGLVIGGAIGFSYYYFIGCSSGTCPITSSPYISTIYGAVSGLIITFPTKKKNKEWK